MGRFQPQMNTDKRKLTAAMHSGEENMRWGAPQEGLAGFGALAAGTSPPTFPRIHPCSSVAIDGRESGRPRADYRENRR